MPWMSLNALIPANSRLPNSAALMTRRAGLCLLLAACGSGLAWAGGAKLADVVTVRDAWVRPAVAGQSGTGGYLTIEARQPVTLLGFKTPVATEAELHEMRMAGDVMQMRPVSQLPLKAGEVLTLAPGGRHLMLMGLKQALPAGGTVPLTLAFKTAKGQRLNVQVLAAVQRVAPAPAAAAPASAGSAPAH